MKTRVEFNGFVPEEGQQASSVLDPLATSEEEAPAPLDYDLLADKVAARLRQPGAAVVKREGVWNVANLFGRD